MQSGERDDAINSGRGKTMCAEIDCVPSGFGSYPLTDCSIMLTELSNLCNSLICSSPCLHKLIVHIFKFRIPMPMSHSSPLMV